MSDDLKARHRGGKQAQSKRSIEGIFSNNADVSSETHSLVFCFHGADEPFFIRHAHQQRFHWHHARGQRELFGGSLAPLFLIKFTIAIGERIFTIAIGERIFSIDDLIFSNDDLTFSNAGESVCYSPCTLGVVKV